MCCLLCLWSIVKAWLRRGIPAHNDLVDRDKYQLHEKPNETHDNEADGSPDGDLVEFSSIGLRASFDKADAVLSKLLQRIDHCVHLIHPLQQAQM